MNKVNSSKARFCVQVIIVLLTVGLVRAQGNQSTFCIDLTSRKRVTEVPVFKSYDNVYNPTIQVFIPDGNQINRRAVLICPGGGYSMVTSGYEGSDWANYFNGIGIVGVVLKYRLPKGNGKIPVGDAGAALMMLKDSAKVWKINPDDIGIMGFSAGGHLASTVATHASDQLRPRFQILFYPVITMDKSFTHIGSHDNFLGSLANPESEDLYSNEKQVTANTPQAFIAFAADDRIVAPANGIKYFQALTDKGVPAALHIYPTGGHGWDFSKHYKYQKEILLELASWLEDTK
jgi:acetyl esterase/lipase